jgi:hypothetical protein
MKKVIDVARRAGDLFDSGLNCAESLLVAFAEECGIDCPAFPGVATGFCAGVSRTCGTWRPMVQAGVFRAIRQ